MAALLWCSHEISRTRYAGAPLEMTVSLLLSCHGKVNNLATRASTFT